MAGRSSGSVTLTVTESGRRSGGRERRSVSGDRTKNDGEGEKGRMERTRTGSERWKVKKKRSVPWSRKKVTMLENPLTRRGRRRLPKTTRKRRVLKESA